MDTSEGLYRCGTVVLLGPPNAGKSTLLNTFLGQKLAIVTPKPQTTRNQITGILTDDDSQIIFLDTPGVHRMRGRMNRFLLQSAWAGVEAADCIVIMADADLYSRKPQLLARELDPIVKGVQRAHQPVYVALNKIDLVRDKAALLPLMQVLGEMWPEAGILPISASKGKGLDELLATVKKHLPEGPPMFPEDQLSTVPLRFMAAETIREKLFMSLKQELPYSTAVEIEQWDEDENGLIRIGALIWVARDNHKAMVIGKGGQNLKEIGRASRLELKQLLGGKVHLEMWVKVRRDWTEDSNFLRTIGLGE
ncbi:GTPase Era [Desulfovibrio ferrophilus]|uniref:GTPase Era n=1 Tax=Desulfovibrio ferrophilus TaxID=241368 RepID=A0A2Z6B1K5_9BACT|nr:GTPase Era [Desulfovibrio ferrophilus]BBD09407.1 GTPase Era [Desulfovibrio ferrophilus]